MSLSTPKACTGASDIILASLYSELLT